MEKLISANGSGRRGLLVGIASVRYFLFALIFFGVALGASAGGMSPIAAACLAFATVLASACTVRISRRTAAPPPANDGRALDRLRLSERVAQLEEAESLANMGHWNWDAATDTVTWSRQVFRIHHRDESLGAPNLAGALACYAPDSADKLRAAVDEAMRTGKPYDILLRVASDREQWMRGVGSARHDANGKFIGLYGTVRDVTDEVIRERQLADREARLARVTDGSSDGFWEYCPATGVVWYSDRFIELLGAKRSEFPATFDSFAHRLHRNDLDRVKQRLEAHIERAEPYDIEYRLRIGDGTREDYRWFKARGRSLRDAAGRSILMSGSICDIHERREAEQRLQLAVSAANAGTWDWQIPNRSVVVNRQFMSMLGEPDGAGVCPDSVFFSRLHPDDVAGVDAAIKKAWKSADGMYEIEIRLRGTGGAYRWIRSNGRVVERTPDGSPLRMIGQHIDIDAIVRHRLEVAKNRGHLAQIFESLAEGIIVVGGEGQILEANPSASSMLGMQPALQRCVLDERVRLIDEHGVQIAREDLPPLATLRSGISNRNVVIGLQSDLDEIIWLSSNTVAIPDDNGHTSSVVWSFVDITARRNLEAELRSAARSDKLTGLLNRSAISERLQQAILRAKRNPAYHFAVLYLDFDRFKLVNDSLGHQAGDELLRQISGRLSSVLREGDGLARFDENSVSQAAARLGGDEFVVLLDGLASPESACVAADRLLKVLARPYQIAETEVYSTASIGIVTSAVATGTVDDALRDADTAMYEAKLAGKGRFVMFDAPMRLRVQARLNMENDLRRAVEAEQLTLVYQPIVNLETGKFSSVEALVRWTHPTRGPISPAEFIPVAEDTGLVVQIGEWVLRKACEQFAKWRSTPGGNAPATVSVNLSRNQLALRGLPGLVRRVLQECELEPSCLQLEITETTVMRDLESSVRNLKALKSIGVKLALDDFGTGHSSLSCLHQFPLDVLKVDRSFIANIDRGRDFAALVHAITSLARNLGIAVVAEGVETAEHVAILQSLDCQFAQGYYFARPLPAADIPGFRVVRPAAAA